ncbi:MAG: DUF1684 domain-containing protein [Thermoflexaceae bacterium]|nr:DUF1684 domain-containing protein [Thermoflexaceae bacterium]
MRHLPSLGPPFVRGRRQGRDPHALRGPGQWRLLPAFRGRLPRRTETYGAGRYLDVEPLPDGRLHVDFNYAYNPYCAYNDAWSCPIPPRENMLNVHIRAGERTFHDEP